MWLKSLELYCFCEAGLELYLLTLVYHQIFKKAHEHREHTVEVNSFHEIHLPHTYIYKHIQFSSEFQPVRQKLQSKYRKTFRFEQSELFQWTNKMFMKSLCICETSSNRIRLIIVKNSGNYVQILHKITGAYWKMNLFRVYHRINRLKMIITYLYPNIIRQNLKKYSQNSCY